MFDNYPHIARQGRWHRDIKRFIEICVYAVYMYVCICLCVGYMNICIYVYVYVRMYIHMYFFIYVVKKKDLAICSGSARRMKNERNNQNRLYNHQLYTIFPLQITVIIIHLSISNHSHYHRDIIFLGDEQPVVALPDV